jgi:hypothetical protein
MYDSASNGLIHRWMKRPPGIHVFKDASGFFF